jgi:hypothetical protein
MNYTPYQIPIIEKHLEYYHIQSSRLTPIIFRISKAFVKITNSYIFITLN